MLNIRSKVIMKKTKLKKWQVIATMLNKWALQNRKEPLDIHNQTKGSNGIHWGSNWCRMNDLAYPIRTEYAKSWEYVAHVFQKHVDHWQVTQTVFIDFEDFMLTFSN